MADPHFADMELDFQPHAWEMPLTLQQGSMACSHLL